MCVLCNHFFPRCSHGAELQLVFTALFAATTNVLRTRFIVPIPESRRAEDEGGGAKSKQNKDYRAPRKES